MNKKELEKLREKLRAENPLLTEDQIEDIIAESENGLGEAGSKADPPQGPDELLKAREALEAEREKLAKEKEALEADKKALAEKEAALAAGAVSLPVRQTDSKDSGKVISYTCKTRCTFNGLYYREGDRLTTTGAVPDFFEAAEEA